MIIAYQCHGKIRFFKKRFRNRKINKRAIGQNGSKIMVPRLSCPRTLKYIFEKF